MDFTRTPLTGLLNNSTHEKARFTNILHKLKAILELDKSNKLILTQLDKLVLTSSPRIIYENLNFSHPILKILVEYIQKTTKIVDGDKMVVKILSGLVDEVEFLLDNGMKPKAISDGLKDIEIQEMAMQTDLLEDVKCMALENEASKPNSQLSQEMKAYIHGLIREETVSKLLIEAIEYTQSFDVEKIRICKVNSGSLEDSYRTNGMLISRQPEGRITTARGTSVGIFNCPFDINRTELKGTILMHTSEELLKFSTEENQMAKNVIDSLNVNVVIVCGTVNDVFMDFANSRNLLVLRIFNKYDLKRLCDLLGGSIYTTLGPVKSKGFVESIEVVRDADCAFTKIVAAGEVTTIVLKNSIDVICDEMERRILNVLENLHYNHTHIDSSPRLSTPDFSSMAAKAIGRETVIASCVSKAIVGVRFTPMLLTDSVKCLKYAIEFLAKILEIDDYLISKTDQIDVKPRENPHWDD